VLEVGAEAATGRAGRPGLAARRRGASEARSPAQRAL